MSLLKENLFTCLMLLGIIGGSITGLLWPNATVLEPLGTVFVNLMFCVVVPMVFFSVSSAIANMPDMRKVGSILWKTIAVFLVTAAIDSGLSLRATMISTRAFPMSFLNKLPKRILNALSSLREPRECQKALCSMGTTCITVLGEQ